MVGPDCPRTVARLTLPIACIPYNLPAVAGRVSFLTRVTRSLPRQDVSPPAGRKIPFFFTQMLHRVQYLCEKEKNVPCCRRRFCRSGLAPGWSGHLDHEHHEMSEIRETVNADIDQVIPHFVGDIASGRAEANSSFARKNSLSELFCEKEKSVPCCRQRFGRSPSEIPGLMNDRVTRVNNRSYAVGPVLARCQT